jgi:death-on-curing protein
MAAAYLFHIVTNHPFVDGNKRTGTAAALVFLDINGISIEAKNGELSELTLAVSMGSAGKQEISQFFESHQSN